jgi:Flp pilus assembly CpaE family ATPase
MTNPIVKKDTFVEILKAAGITDEQMAALHCQFEKKAPEDHQRFLEALEIPESEIVKIRKSS